MSTILREGAVRFHVYANAAPGRPRVEVALGEGECSFWLEPVRLASAQRIAPYDVRQLERQVAARQAWFVEKWHESFAD